MSYRVVTVAYHHSMDQLAALIALAICELHQSQRGLLFFQAWQFEWNGRGGVIDCSRLKAGSPTVLMNAIIKGQIKPEDHQFNMTNREMKSRLMPFADTRNTRPNALFSLQAVSSSSSLSSSSISIHPLLAKPRL